MAVYPRYRIYFRKKGIFYRIVLVPVPEQNLKLSKFERDYIEPKNVYSSYNSMKD